nr:hypothetical protein [Mesorhizobium sp.]
MGEIEIASGTTDGNGGFRFRTPEPVSAEITVAINTGEGHVASRTLPARRFSASVDDAAGDIAIQSDVSRPLDDKNVQKPALVEAAIEAAVERQLAPLLERVEQMDARMRLTDVIASVCLILGIGGIVLWARGRRS